MQSMSSVRMLVLQTSPSVAMLWRQQLAPTRFDGSLIVSGNGKRLQARDVDVPFLHGRNPRNPIVRSVAQTSFSFFLWCLVLDFYFFSFSFLFHLVYRFRLFDPGSSHILWYSNRQSVKSLETYQEHCPSFSGLYVTMKLNQATKKVDLKTGPRSFHGKTEFYEQKVRLQISVKPVSHSDQ